MPRWKTVGGLALVGVMIVALPSLVSAQEFGKIGNRVWADLNGNGIYDPGEPGLAQVDIRAYDLAFEPQSPANQTGNSAMIGATAAGGWWGMSFPVGRCYSIVVILPEGYTVSPLGGDSKANDRGVIERLCAEPGTDNSFDIGLVPTDPNSVAQPVMIGNRVWHDVNGDGVQDPGEPGVAGAEISVVDAATRELIVQGPASAQGYWGAEIPAGTCVNVSIGTGVRWAPTIHTPTDPDWGNVVFNNVCPTADDLSVNAGFHQLNSDPVPTITASAEVWWDNNDNGLRDDGDTPARGIEMTISPRWQVWGDSRKHRFVMSGTNGSITGTAPFIGYDETDFCNTVSFAGTAETTNTSRSNPTLYLAATPVGWLEPNAFAPLRLSTVKRSICYRYPSNASNAIEVPLGTSTSSHVDILLRGRDPYLEPLNP